MKVPNLKRARENRGYTQDDVVLRSNISRSHICALEKGYSQTSPKTAQKLADALQYEIWQLVSDDPKVLQEKIAQKG